MRSKQGDVATLLLALERSELSSQGLYLWRVNSVEVRPINCICELIFGAQFGNVAKPTVAVVTRVYLRVLVAPRRARPFQLDEGGVLNLINAGRFIKHKMDVFAYHVTPFKDGYA